MTHLGRIPHGVVRDLRRQRHVERLHRLGPRVLDELLQEIGAERSCMTSIEMKLERYAKLDRGVIAAGGSNRLPRTPIHAVNDLPEDAA